MAGRCRSSVDPAASRAGSRRLAIFTDELRETLGSAATIETGRVGPYSAVSLEPRRTDALGISWLHSDDEVVLSVGSGGRWELEPTEQDVQYLEDIVLSVVAGRVGRGEGQAQGPRPRDACGRHRGHLYRLRRPEGPAATTCAVTRNAQDVRALPVAGSAGIERTGGDAAVGARPDTLAAASPVPG